jgi:hypothetical protein
MSLMGLCIFNQEACAITVEELKAPINAAHESLFAWANVIYIAAGVSGLVMAVAKGSVLPLGTGLGIGIGGRLLQSYLAVSSTGAAALI